MDFYLLELHLLKFLKNKTIQPSLNFWATNFLSGYPNTHLIKHADTILSYLDFFKNFFGKYKMMMIFLLLFL